MLIILALTLGLSLQTGEARRAIADPGRSTLEVDSDTLGLPQECLTYSQRYKQYSHGLRHSSAANALHPHSKFVVVLQLHQSHRASMPQDALVNLRSVASEVTQAGYHFYILYQMPTQSFYMLTALDQVQMTREEMLEFLPLDLRPFVIVHDFDSDFAAYPELGKKDAEHSNAHPSHLWGPGPRAAYVAMSRFMQTYQAYQYSWIMEFDVRWTGSSWGEFLNAALDLGRQATEEEAAAEEWRIVKADRAASRQLPHNFEGLPDLMAFRGVRETDKWKEMLHNMGNASTLWDIQATVYLASRKLWDAVHDYSTRGIGSHIEVALATIAMQQGLKAVGLPLPQPAKYHDAFHCCTEDASVIYGKWYQNAEVCTQSWLLHPVKLKESYWLHESSAA